jgi:hypothetical protein
MGLKINIMSFDPYNNYSECEEDSISCLNKFKKVEVCEDEAQSE